jgi:hypothetical protein
MESCLPLAVRIMVASDLLAFAAKAAVAALFISGAPPAAPLMGPTIGSCLRLPRRTPRLPAFLART